jgi:hypothetical protein
VTKAQKRVGNAPGLATIFRRGKLELAQGSPGAGGGPASPVPGMKEGYVRTRTTGRDLYL